MRKASVLLAFTVLAGCGSSPPKAEIPISSVAGEYHGYMEPNVIDMDPVEQGIMKTVRFMMLTIKADGQYTVVIDQVDRKKDNGKVLDKGTIEIQGKSIVFRPTFKLDEKKLIDQSFTVLEGARLEPYQNNKLTYVFKGGHRMVLFKSG